MLIIILQAAFRVHIQDILYKTWQYNMLINSVISFYPAVARKDTTLYGGDGRKRYLLFTFVKYKFKMFLLHASFSSEPRTFPHHCGWGSTFKIWFINAAWNIINSSFMPYELHQKGSQSTGAGQQPVTAWRAASHSAMDWRGFLREF